VFRRNIGVTSSRRLGVAVHHLISECKERSCVVDSFSDYSFQDPHSEPKDLEQVATIANLVNMFNRLPYKPEVF
jgi:hypothetical protein